MSQTWTWTVVKFLNDNSVEAVPTNWITNNNTICLWPPYAPEKISSSIRKQEQPSSTWDKFKIQTFSNAVYDDYTVARKKRNKAQEYSDLESDDAQRTRKPLVCHEEFDSDSEMELETRQRLPAPPKLSLKDNQTKSKELCHEVDAASSENVVYEHLSQPLCTCCPQHENPTDLIKRLIRQISIMTITLTNIQTTIEKLKFPNEETLDHESILTLFNMPLKIEEELSIFEDYLADDGNMQTAVTELAKIGGDTSDEYIKRVMTRLISSQLASEYSWKGLKGKKVMCEKRITKLLIDSAFQNKMTAKCTLKEIEESIKKFLRRSKERAVAEEKRNA